MFKPVSAKVSIPEVENEVLDFWRQQHVFERTMSEREDGPRYVFYEGPPTANGLPHPGHCLTRVMKDLFLLPDLIPTVCAFAKNLSVPFVAGEHNAYVRQIARRIYFNSPHATFVADTLIRAGLSGLMEGRDIEELAEWELKYHLIPVFQHPDALEGLSAMMERRFPNFNRLYPL